MRRFEGRVAVVTGAAQGMGKAVAQRLGQEGATFVASTSTATASATAKKSSAAAHRSYQRHRRSDPLAKLLRPSKPKCKKPTCW
jgi:NAD(P)-dependent dehydrogenase (short-subunit alcohol dehydrogenase family)